LGKQRWPDIVYFLNCVIVYLWILLIWIQCVGFHPSPNFFPSSCELELQPSANLFSMIQEKRMTYQLLKCSSVFCPVRKLFYNMLTASYFFFLNLCRFLILLSFLKQNMMSPYFVPTFSPLLKQTLSCCKLASSSTVAFHLYKGCSPFSILLLVVEKSTMCTVFSTF